MAEFRFNCPQCNEELEAAEDMTGETVECPSCEAHFEVPAAGGNDAGAADASGSGCPSCGVEMPADAVLCVQCGYNVKLGKKIDTSFE